MAVVLTEEQLQKYGETNDLIRHIVAPNRNAFNRLSALEQVLFIRDWVFRTLPAGNSPHYDIPFVQLFIKSIFMERGFICGGHSYILARLYTIFGFEAVNVNFGIRQNKTTHVMTAVCPDGDDCENTILVDPYLGINICTVMQGKHANFFDLLRGLKNGNSDLFAYEKTNIDAYKIMFDGYGQHTFNIEIINGINCVHTSSFQKVMMQHLEKKICAFGHEKSIISYLPLVIGVGSECGSLKTKIKSFLAREMNIFL